MPRARQSSISSLERVLLGVGSEKARPLVAEGHVDSARALMQGIMKQTTDKEIRSFATEDLQRILGSALR